MKLFTLLQMETPDKVYPRIYFSKSIILSLISEQIFAIIGLYDLPYSLTTGNN